MSKKDNSQVKLPAGFRLTNDTRKDLVKVALKDKFGKRTEELFNQEIEHLNALCEYLYPLEKRRILEYGTTVFEYRYTPLMFVNSISIDDVTIGASGYHYSSVNTGLLENLDYMGWQKDNEQYAVLVPKSEFRYSSSDIRKKLPKAYYDKLFAFILKCEAFVKKRNAVKAGLETLLLNYSSARVLCEAYPEFIDWIYQYMELPPSCSDASSHDIMQEIRKTVATV